MICRRAGSIFADLPDPLVALANERNIAKWAFAHAQRAAGAICRHFIRLSFHPKDFATFHSNSKKALTADISGVLGVTMY